MGRGGQVSIEYISVVAFSFLMLIPLLLMFYVQSTSINADLDEAQVRTAGETIMQAAERVYYAGPPTKETVRVRFPAGLQGVEVINESAEGGSLVFTMGGAANYELLIPGFVPLADAESELCHQQGPAVITVQALPIGAVRILDDVNSAGADGTPCG